MIGRVAIYYRVSTDSQDFASQKREVEKYIEALEDPPVSIEVYQDKASGKTIAKRPEFEKMIEAGRSGEIDTIVCYKLDRFSRDANTAIRLILELDEKKVAFVSVTQAVLNLGHDNPFRRTMLAAFSEIAQIERETICARVKAGLRAAKERGVKLGPARKYDPEEILRLVNDGLSYSKIHAITGAAKSTISDIVRSHRS